MKKDYMYDERDPQTPKVQKLLLYQDIFSRDASDRKT